MAVPFVQIRRIEDVIVGRIEDVQSTFRTNPIQRIEDVI
jgi:hypothetical protein